MGKKKMHAKIPEVAPGVWAATYRVTCDRCPRWVRLCVQQDELGDVVAAHLRDRHSPILWPVRPRAKEYA